MMSRAHASGVLTCLIALIISGTIAVALKLPWAFWSVLIFTPFIFQFAAGKAWRDIRPRTLLSYLAARSAARRYAFVHNARDMNLSLLFRGYCEHIFESEDVTGALEAAIANTKEAEVWIALFGDSVIMISERPGGARCEFGHQINTRLQLEGRSLSDQGEYASDRELILTSTDRFSGKKSTVRVTSPYPAALVVFEKRLAAAIAQAQANGPLIDENAAALLDTDSPSYDRFAY